MADARQGRLATAADAFRAVFHNPDLRRVQLALAAAMLGGSGYQIALAVVAFGAGGAGGVGVAFAVQILPLGIVAPFTSVLADRFPRPRVMLAIDLMRALCTGSVAVAVFAGAPLALVLALGAPGALASTAYQPASRALLPSLVEGPEQLTASNVVSSGIEHAGLLVGPALAGLLLALADPGAVFAAGAALFLLSGLLVARIRGGRERPTAPGERQPFLAEVSAGARNVARERALRVLVGLYAGQSLVLGALQVLIVVLALETLALGDSGTGELFAALGVGGMLGALVAAGLAGRERLSGPLAGGVVLWGAALAATGAFPGRGSALCGLALIGAANVLVDVCVITLLQRSVPERVLGRVFGVLESALLGMVGSGALLAPLVIDALDVRLTLVATGSLGPLLIALLWRRLRAIDAAAAAPSERVALLRRLSLFEPLPAPTLEALAASLIPLTVPDGEAVISQGEPGDRFYLVEAGSLEVLVDGTLTTTHEEGEGFGEIALLRELPRMATVRARGEARLYALERDVFVSAVTGHPVSAAAAEAVVSERLGQRSPLSLP